VIKINEINIGKKVQDFRTARNITVRGLSSLSGITGSMISQIEHNQVNPSINSLKLIAKALEIPLYYFFQDDADSQDLIVRKEERKTIGLPNQQDIMYELLTPDVKGAIEFCMMSIPANSDTGEVTQSHNGEEVAYVVEGNVHIVLGAGDRHELFQGDSIRIPTMTNHRWENKSNDIVKVIFAITPPSF